MNDILLSPLRLSELENLIEKSVRRALATTTISSSEAEPYGDFKWLTSICPGIPPSTLRIKSASGAIPGVIKFGKRVLYEKATVLEWLRTLNRTQPNADEIGQAAEAQISQQLSKKRGVK